MADNDPANNQPAGYVPPKVWTWDQGHGGAFVGINAPTAGARQEVVVEMAERDRALVRLAPALVAPRQLELRVDRLDGSDELIEIRVEELVDQVQRVLGSEASLAAPLRARQGADRESIERRMREVEAELAVLEARLRAVRRQPE